MTTQYDKTFQEVYKKLNDRQKDAVDALEGPVLVLAGPGTGKTQILTSRIANILTKTDTNPSEILALTFTESGVRAMRDRLRSIIGPTAYDIGIYTFHSFATDVIRNNPSHFIIHGDIEPLSDLERIFIFRDILDKSNFKMIKPFNASYYYLGTIINKIKYLKREGILPDEYQTIIKESEIVGEDLLKNQELLEVYIQYEEMIKASKRYDFEDMINFVIKAFETNSELLLKYQERFLYFLVDEFQDTNGSQFELLTKLTEFDKENPNLFVVGDDDQSIYRFQGASIDNIKSFLEKYPNCKKVVLDKNYRSQQYVLDAAASLIAHNENRISSILDITKSLKSEIPEDKSSVQIDNFEFINHYAESFFIADKVRELIASGTNPAEIAVIYRNNQDVETIAEMFSRFGIRYEIAGGENILSSGIIRRVIHILNVISRINIKQEESELFVLMNYEFIKLKPLDVLKLSRYATEKKIPLFEAVYSDEVAEIGIDIQAFRDFFDMIATLQEKSHNAQVFDFIRQLLDDTGYLIWVLNQKDNFRLLNKLNSFLSDIKKLNQTNHKLSLRELVNNLELMIEHNIRITEEDLNLSENSVNLMTAHKSKGLEFQHVFIPYFTDKKWGNNVIRDLIKIPSNVDKNPIDPKTLNDEDERRLVYVAITRTKNHLYISNAKTYGVTGEKDAISSKYLYEIDPVLVNNANDEKYNQIGIELLQTIMQSRSSPANDNPDEIQFLQNALKNFKLSATSLNTYLDCAYKFKLDFLFHTPRELHKALTMGSSIHYALENAYKKLINNEVASIDFMITKFNEFLDKQIVSAKDYKEIKSEGEATLTKYYEKYKEEFSNSEHNILFLEKYFGFDFDLPVLDGDILLQGKIDKIIDLNIDDKSVKIVDYKTGKPKTRNEILGKTANSDGKLFRQMLFYKLLVELSRRIKLKVNIVELDFLGNGKLDAKRESFDVSDISLDGAKEEIRSTWKAIHELKFERTTDLSTCKGCAYEKHCWPNGIGKHELN